MVLGWIDPVQVSGVSVPASAALPALARDCCVDLADDAVFDVLGFGAVPVGAADGVVAGDGVGSANATAEGPTLNPRVAITAVRRLTWRSRDDDR